MLVADHGLQVIPEQQLAGCVVLRCDHVDGLVGVDGDKSGPAQLLGQVGADNLGAVQAEDGVYNGGGHIVLYQGLGGQLGLALAGLQGGHVQIAVDVGVVGGKMAVDKL